MWCSWRKKDDILTIGPFRLTIIDIRPEEVLLEVSGPADIPIKLEKGEGKFFLEEIPRVPICFGDALLLGVEEERTTILLIDTRKNKSKIGLDGPGEISIIKSKI